ncbi:endonuclease/exonuclease/phosphatase family protein [Lutibacter flavus]|uniref:Metal-dependent hydrolase, endonuclease/exonuclease/phosphatase family n=1 Tax=Lutibacter flavus TaxID=691689 RepID=A0A238VXY4_9FLAO|nr:endonuclease/exonuclease/phosphatase family protein [Lutibacter flavus]SNR39205.1 Metal-dependent hydrolase, endonuclease/exonuclease/phosphatase family [Lutibacter flavus]
MQKLSLVDKLLFIVNSLLATMLLISFLSYYISPNTFSFISFISLSIPFLIILNLLFIIYWILKLKKQFLLSTIILLIGFQFITKFYSFSEKKVLLTNDLKVMSYNVRMFNLYNWIDEKNVDQKIYDFIKEKSPDILCIQEFHPSKELDIKYPYQYVKIRTNHNNFGHAIFSKYKIIKSGSLDFSNSSNNAIFADIVKDKDTIRVYNVHLESLKINPKEETLTQENSEKLRIRVEKAFKKQTNQADLILLHQEKATYKSIICGDFNNNAFSWVYNTLKTNKNDAFEVAGKGFGKSFDYHFPFRIDFILTDKKFEVNNFKTYDVKYSDHYPIMARINFNTN